jgi:hypothetical protein
MAEFSVMETLSTINCANCTMTFAMPKRFETGRRNDHKSFYCPQGHGQSFSGESDAEKLRRERDSARQALARVEDEKRQVIAAAERKIAAAKKETTKLKKRASAGTCPCCQRTVSQMARHMKTKHPEFVAEEITNVVAMKAAK